MEAAKQVICMCQEFVGALEARGALHTAIHGSPDALERLDYIRHVAGLSAAAYLPQVIGPSLAEDFDPEFGHYVRLADFAGEGELADYVMSGLSVRGQYVRWGGGGAGYFQRLVHF